MNPAPKAQQSGQITYKPWSILSVPSKNIKFHHSLPTKPLSKRDQHRLSVALNKPVRFPGKSSRLTEKQQSAIAKRYGEHDEFFHSVATQNDRQHHYQ